MSDPRRENPKPEQGACRTYAVPQQIRNELQRGVAPVKSAPLTDRKRKTRDAIDEDQSSVRRQQSLQLSYYFADVLQMMKCRVAHDGIERCAGRESFTSHKRYSIFGAPLSSRAIASIGSEISSANTERKCRDNSYASRPDPQPMSSTESRTGGKFARK